jgi:hypothetical protein
VSFLSRALVPYGVVWRTAANEATQFRTIEQFTIVIQPRGGRSGVLTLPWDTTQASVPIRVEK